MNALYADIDRLKKVNGELATVCREAFYFLHLNVQLDGIHDAALMKIQCKLQAAIAKAEEL
jgi:hypothetical protein